MNYFDYWLFRSIKNSNKKEITTRPSPVKVVERPLTETEIAALQLGGFDAVAPAVDRDARYFSFRSNS